jgi:GTPase SAR1 family protein
MVPGDSDDIKHEYEVLLNELKKFNPDMLDKHRVLAVTKCDLLDDELIEMLKETLPDSLPVVFISSVTGFGLNELKDVLWRELNSESNKLQEIVSEDTLVHRDKDMAVFAEEIHAEGADDNDVEFVDDDDIKDAGIALEQINYINAHATSTPVGDLNEAKAIAEVFEGHHPYVTSTKSMTGHEMWMAGASEVIYSTLMMNNGFIAPNLNFEEPDEASAQLNIPTQRVNLEFDTFLSNSFGFGGTNSTLIIRKINP